MRKIAKLKSILRRQDLEKVIHAFISTRVTYRNTLYVGVSHASLYRLQLIQNAAKSTSLPFWPPSTGSQCVTELILKFFYMHINVIMTSLHSTSLTYFSRTFRRALYACIFHA